QAELVTIAMTLALAADRLRDSGDDRGRELVGRARSQTGKAIADLRRLIDGFSPAALDDGLAEALRALAAEAAIPVTLRAEVSEEVDEAIERTAYFCAVELLTNVAKHSGARSTTVDVGTAGDVLRLRVVDDGRGGAGVGAGTGLLGLRERLAAVDGTLTAHSPVGGPTTVDVTLPARL
ncbi:MAG TPA: ATP-binding protein, partial [Phytomonospora sp.]